MTLRDELEILRLCEPPFDLEDWNVLCGLFIRDHGKAILDVLARYEALRCEADILCQAIRGYNFAGVGPIEDPFVESCVLAVESCLFKSHLEVSDA